MKKVILTGGGTAGHVTPNIALLPGLRKEGYKISYIGSRKGIEKELITAAKVEYFGISSGKLRRYFDLRNVTDAFRVLKGLGDAVKIVKSQRPDIIFSKGGFVSVPVVVAGRICGVPIVIHESDLSPGLANKISIPFAKTVCVSFPETLERLPKKRCVLTGTPIRRQLFTGDKSRGLKLCGFNQEKPVVLVMGGSSGSLKINKCLRGALGRLTKSYQIAHICGKGNLDEGSNMPGYKQFEYVSNELPHVLAAADCVVSRAGANSISEFLALKKPNLLIPLSRNASRGDQILNAESFKRQGFSKVLSEERMTEETLITEIIDLYNSRESYVEKMNQSPSADSTGEVLKVIRDALKYTESN